MLGFTDPGEDGDEALASMSLSSTSEETLWTEDLAQRLRVLLHADPILSLRRGDSRADPEFRHYDSVALAIKAIDLILAHTGLGREMDPDRLFDELTPMMEAMDREAGTTPDPERHHRLFARLLDGLRGDRQARRPFELEYMDLSPGDEAIRRQLSVRIIYDHYHTDGRTVLRVSDEATNLFLRALDQDIEDAQVAAEALIEHQLEDGRFNKAVQSAREAQLQSSRYGERIRSVLEDTRRDIRRVDWRSDIPQLLSEAMQHVAGRQEVESNILETADETLRHLEDGTEEARQVARIIKLVRACRTRHVELHGELMDARDVFLEEQGRQAFQPAPRTKVPDLGPDVLRPLLGLDKKQARAVTDEAAPALLGPDAPSLMSLPDQLAWLLQPRQRQRQGDVPMRDRDVVKEAPDPERYPPEVRRPVDRKLAELSSPTPLSDLLEDVLANGDGGEAAAEYLAFVCFENWAPDHDETETALEVPTVLVERWPGHRLEIDAFDGDDLIVHPQPDGRPNAPEGDTADE